MALRAPSVFEGLRLSTECLRRLPVQSQQPEETPDSSALQAQGFCFVYATPAALEQPKLVAASESAVRLLGLQPEQSFRTEFAEFLAGSRLLPGSCPAAHCYAGHRCGAFLGQMGDSSAVYLGEAEVFAGGDSTKRWELQLGGVGPTPFTQKGCDGRLALRSCISELVISEALYHLGVPTVRAVAVSASSSCILRQDSITGVLKQERAGTILRLAPTFLRFGSLEVCRDRSAPSLRAGPSAGLQDKILPQILDFAVKEHLPDIWGRHNGDQLQRAAAEGAGTVSKQEMYLDLLREAVMQTAALSAAWQAVGFIHGSLGTDTLSLLGFTIGAGATGSFMGRYNPYAAPANDPSGYHAFKHQPEVCFWGCEKLAEALYKGGMVLPGPGKAEVNGFWSEHERFYRAIMRRRLGLLVLDEESADDALVRRLLEVMAATGADFSCTFRWLEDIPMPIITLTPDGETSSCPIKGDVAPGGEFLEKMVSSLPRPRELADASVPQPSVEALQMLLVLSQRDSRALSEFGTSTRYLEAQLSAHKTAERLRKMTAAEKEEEDRRQWLAWLSLYSSRLAREAASGGTEWARSEAMRSINPRVTPRDEEVAAAAKKAEGGDFSSVRRLLEAVSHPYVDANLAAAQKAERP